MKDEIKEIFNIEELFDEWKQFLSLCYENNDKTVEIHRDKLKWTMDYITNLQTIEQQYSAILSENSELENKITNLQEENRQTKLLKERYQLEKEDYKSRNEKTINELIRVLQIILEQPSKDKLDDLWIINRLEGIQTLLQGENNTPENLYKYTPEKGFRLVGDDNE